MYHFIESIRVQNGVMPLLDLHQMRLNRTMEHHGSANFDLRDSIDVPSGARKGIYKCRVTYSTEGLVRTEFIEYKKRRVVSISPVNIGDRVYPFKYGQRNWIEDLLKQSGTDEIMMCQNGRITDASYANLVFFDGNRWITPAEPLLRGVRRHQLLLDQLIVEEDLRLEDLSRFSHVKLINAMMTWEESPVLIL